MSQPNFTTLFNTLFFKLIETVVLRFPSDRALLTAEKALTMIRKLNPKMIYRVWNYYVATPYKEEIARGDVEFFINKDYTNDLSDYVVLHNDRDIYDAIDRLREPVKRMNPEHQQEIMMMIQSLSKLAELYSK